MTGAAKLPSPVLIITARVARGPMPTEFADNHVQNSVAIDVPRSGFLRVIYRVEIDRREETGLLSIQAVMPQKRDR